MKPRLHTLGLAAALGLGGTAHGLDMVMSDVTATLGPDFFFDAAATGGSDATQNEPGSFFPRRDFGALNVGPGGTELTITGLGWASPNWAFTDAQTVTATIIYLGADGANDGGDDVVIGSVTDNFIFSGAGEYAWAFDTPMTAVIDGANTFFRVRIAPANDTGDGSIRIKQEVGGIKLSVAGTSTAVGALLPGDADGDGDVDDTDLGLAISNFTGPGETGKTAADGDTDADGDVDDTDLGVMISGFTGPLSPAAVPEPASLALLSLGGLLIARRRRA